MANTARFPRGVDPPPKGSPKATKRKQTEPTSDEDIDIDTKRQRKSLHASSSDSGSSSALSSSENEFTDTPKEGNNDDEDDDKSTSNTDTPPAGNNDDEDDDKSTSKVSGSWGEGYVPFTPAKTLPPKESVDSQSDKESQSDNDEEDYAPLPPSKTLRDNSQSDKESQSDNDESDEPTDDDDNVPFSHLKQEHPRPAFGYEYDLTDDIYHNILSYAADGNIVSRLCELQLISHKWYDIVMSETCSSESWDMAFKQKFSCLGVVYPGLFDGPYMHTRNDCMNLWPRNRLQAVLISVYNLITQPGFWS